VRPRSAKSRSAKAGFGKWNPFNTQRFPWEPRCTGARRLAAGALLPWVLTRETSMRRACTLAAMIWLIGVASACAQTAPTSGMGATSPLGTAPSNSSTIPLGATELSQPGISPLVMPCPSTTSNSAFDGGGSTACGSDTANPSAASTASSSNGSTPGLTTGSAAGSGIPLGVTDLGTPGESQNVPVAAPSVSPCSSATTGTANSTNSNGMASASGC
jgi:hypothetical protein